MYLCIFLCVLHCFRICLLRMAPKQKDDILFRFFFLLQKTILHPTPFFQNSIFCHCFIHILYAAFSFHFLQKKSKILRPYYFFFYHVNISFNFVEYLRSFLAHVFFFGLTKSIDTQNIHSID